MNPTVLALIELVPLTAAVVFYWKRAMNLAWDDRPIPVWRQACFGTGLFLAAFVMFNPLGYLADELVIAHMVEHLMIGDIASLLIVLGLTRSILQPILALPLIGRLQVLANPLVAYPLWAANLFIWHIPGLYDAAWGSSLTHGIEHAMFLGFGILMWMPVFGPLPVPTWFGPGWKVIYVVAVRFTAAILGTVLMWTLVPLDANYAAGQAKWGLTAIADQSIAGVIMMIEGTFLIFGVLAWTFFESARQSMRKQELLDLAFEQGIELDPDRADRAVKAGHGDLLERRIRSGEIQRSAGV
ncbi:MAG: cytochrome c oxidase assembly protein [Solirubrobacterales bacterium]